MLKKKQYLARDLLVESWTSGWCSVYSWLWLLDMFQIQLPLIKADFCLRGRLGARYGTYTLVRVFTVIILL